MRYTGLTADASGLIIDTELGKREIVSAVVSVDEGDERRAKIKQKMMELERLKRQEEEAAADDDEDLFGSEEEPVVVDEKGQEV